MTISLQLLVLVLCSIWMSSVAALGVILYLILSKVIKNSMVDNFSIGLVISIGGNFT